MIGKGLSTDGPTDRPTCAKQYTPSSSKRHNYVDIIWFHIKISKVIVYYHISIKVIFTVNVDGSCTYHYHPWTGLIKPSLQHFRFCYVGFSLRVQFYFYFIITSALFLPCGGCKNCENCTKLSFFYNRQPTCSRAWTWDDKDEIEFRIYG